MKKSGLMRIGLYSALARQHIVKAKKIINEKENTSDKEGMLRFRRQIIEQNYSELNFKSHSLK